MHNEKFFNVENILIANLAIRNVDPAIKEALRIRAAKHGRSMEAELREIVRDALRNDLEAHTAGGLATSIRNRLSSYDGVDIPEHPPISPRNLPEFE